MRHVRRSAGVAVVCAVLLSACGHDDSPSRTPAPSPSSSSPSASASPAQPGPAPSGPITAEELAWVQSADNLIERVTLEINRPGGEELTAEEARRQAAALRTCRTGLEALGTPPTTRVSPLVALIADVCATYDHEAECYSTIADLSGKVLNEAEARRMSEAGGCITATSAESGVKLTAFTEESQRLKYLE